MAGEESIINLLRAASTGHSKRSAVDELVARGVAPALATQQLLDALSSGAVLEQGDQIYLHPSLRRGW